MILNKPRLLRRAQLIGVSKGGEHPLCHILIGSGVQTPLASSIDFDQITRVCQHSRLAIDLEALAVTA